MKKTTNNLAETYELAAELLKNFAERAQGKSVVIGLHGDLGSGKTSFVQGVARALGITEHVTSPTFVIEKIYEVPEGGAFKHLIHIDAYRLEGKHDLDLLRVKELFEQSGNLILIEWPEQVELSQIETLNFKFIDDETREIEYFI